MIEKKTEMMTFTKEVATEAVCKCDICGKEIYKEKIDPSNSNGLRHFDFYNPYWTLTTGHYDWGNDSADSIEYFNLCSEECCRKKFEEYLKRSGDPVRDNSEYFHLDH